jgi:hypothetical protein
MAAQKGTLFAIEADPMVRMLNSIPKNLDDIPIMRLERALACAIFIYLESNMSEWTVRLMEEVLQKRLHGELARFGKEIDDIGPQEKVFRNQTVGTFARPPEDGRRSIKDESNASGFTTIEAARHLRISPETLKVMRRTGNGPRFSRRTTRRITAWYTREDLERWIDLKNWQPIE